MYCVYNATTLNNANEGAPFGWPLEQQKYGYFCDQRDKSLILLSNGVLNMMAIVAAYLVSILYLGPAFMKNRKSFEIKPLVRLYNISMILLNLYQIKASLPFVDNGSSFFNCKAVESDLLHAEEIAKLVDLFLLSRLADFLDTIWFVLRKKQSHISFLHLFHHSFAPLAAFVGSRYFPITPFSVALPIVNMGIHVVMYTYYLLSTYPALRQHLWWKRYVTWLQLAQFASVLIYNVVGSFSFGNYCGKYERGALVGYSITCLFFLRLFYMFYLNVYVGTKTKLEKICIERNAIKQD
jgi:hypothetical protein